VPGLQSITDVNELSLPFATVYLTRGEDGRVVDAVYGKGYGMRIGHDDEAFPALPARDL
jgi:hypothetical protein